MTMTVIGILPTASLQATKTSINGRSNFMAN